jgi:LPS-assembly protein
LTSNLYADGFDGRFYKAANCYEFQGLQSTAVPGLSPIVLPTLDYNYVSEPGLYGGHYSFDANALSILRSKGTEDQRGIVRGGWTLPYTAPSGEIYTLTASIRGDFYNTSTLGTLPDPSAPAETGIHARGVPEIGLGWRYPFVRRDGDVRTIVEPIAFAAAAPVYGAQSRFPNEDSRAVDFDATNLFRLNRFDGYDRVEGGERVSYGVNTTFIRGNGGQGSIFLGQSYRLQHDNPFPTGTGLDTQSSNYVGRIVFSPHPMVSARFNAQLDRNTWKPARDTASLSLGPQAFRISASYIFVDKRTQANLTNNVEQFGGVLDSRFTENWRAQLRYLTSLTTPTGELTSGASLIYEDECLVVGLDYTRRFTGTPDAPPDTAYIVRVVFRNLGQITTNVF